MTNPSPRRRKLIKRVKPGEIVAKKYPDKEGNILIARHHGEDTITMSLKLAKEKRIRFLGTIMKKERELIITRNRLLHIHQASNAYGFNERFIKESTRFDTIVLRDEFGEFRFPKSLVLENGFYQHYQKKGYEIQLFVKLQLITPYQVESF